MKKQIFTGSRVGGVGPGQKGGHVLDLLAERTRKAARLGKARGWRAVVFPLNRGAAR